MMLTALTLLTAGCADKGRESDTLYGSTFLAIDQEGKIRYDIVEDFEKSYYDVSELQRLTQDEVDQFNREGTRGSVELGDVVKEGDRVRMTLRMSDADTWSDFMESSLIYDTVAAVRLNGTTFSSDMRDENGDRITTEALADLQEAHVIISSEAQIIETPYSIRYHSRGLNMDGKYAVVPEEDAVLPIVLILSK